LHDKTFLKVEDAGAHQKVLQERAEPLFLCVPAAGFTGNVLTKHKRLPLLGHKVATPLSGVEEYRRLAKSMQCVRIVPKCPWPFVQCGADSRVLSFNA